MDSLVAVTVKNTSLITFIKNLKFSESGSFKISAKVDIESENRKL